MQIQIVVIGKETPASLRELQQEYEKRLKPYAALSWKIIPASRHTDSDQIRNEESEQLISIFKPTDVVVLLDERGMQQTNEEVAQTFERLMGNQGRFVVVIGGAFGVSDPVRERANFVWSFSKLVFPHQLMRVMLLEQLYRTFMVQQGHPYHHS